MDNKNLKYYKDRILFIIDFIKKRGLQSPELLNEYENIEKKVNQCYASEELNKMIKFNSYANDFVRNVPELKIEVDKKFNENIDLRTKKLLEKIYEANEISNDEEFEIVKEEIDRLCQTNKERGKVEILNSILFNYEIKGPSKV